MLKQRVLVALILLPIGIWAINSGGWFFGILMSIILGLAVWEYAAIFKTGGYQPAGFLMSAGVVGIIIARAFLGFELDAIILTAVILIAMGIHAFAFERGRDQAGSDFAVTISGFVYIGLLGSYGVVLRSLPEGQWWVLIVLPAVWWADTGAYFLGTYFGKRKFAPRLSPKKTWEGYFAGILVATLGTPLLVLLYRQLGLNPDSTISLQDAALLGFILGIFPPLGDLGQSMFKRQFGVKDSGTILPGHGGMFDRVDSWLWAMAIGYYVIIWFMI